MSIPHYVEYIGYIKRYNTSSPRLVQSSSNSIRHNCQKICSSLRRTKTILEIRKKARFFKVIKNPIIYEFFKDFTNHRKKTNREVVFSSRPFPKLLNIEATDETFQQSGKEATLRHILKSSTSIYKSSESYSYSSLESPLEYNHDQTLLIN